MLKADILELKADGNYLSQKKTLHDKEQTFYLITVKFALV